MDQICMESADESEHSLVPRKPTSLSTLISWNITKAIEINPNINLKIAIKAVQQQLEKDSRYFIDLVASPEDRFLACAFLAWQQLGHSEADSLYQFVQTKQIISNKENATARRHAFSPGSFISYEDSILFSKDVDLHSFDTFSLAGPVVKLPVETRKTVLRLDNTPSLRNTCGKKRPEKNTMNKISATCCKDPSCIEKLNQVDKSTNELRVRAESLAKREAERVLLLERAEVAWSDLERGYQRRLAMTEEKEDDMSKQIKKLIEERNSYKSACTILAQQLRERGEVAKKERTKLTEIEKEAHESALKRVHVLEEMAHFDAELTEQQCKVAQLDRDIQFKEQEMRRRLQTMKSELESAQCLIHAAEGARHVELSDLRQQTTKVSTQLLEEDANNLRIKEELEQLQQVKFDMMKNLEDCKVLCDERIQSKMDVLKEKRAQRNELREKWIECQCKLPVDASIEVKRTPSLAALCKCGSEDKFLDACSCTSLRTTLLSNLLADLFGGLQSELGDGGSQMPCQLLKCLDDRHNWDKPSIIKTNLQQYFSKLLVGELDIAVATSIEKYHARWVGASCADDAEQASKQEHALERRAQKLAAKLAEQLFKEREEELTAKAKEIVSAGPPPCECKPREAAVYPVLVKQPQIQRQVPATTNSQTVSPMPTFWRHTYHDVTQLKAQLKDLKKVSVKKQDLKIMQENIVKIVQRATVTEDTKTVPFNQVMNKETNANTQSIHRSVNTEKVLIPTKKYQNLDTIENKSCNVDFQKINKAKFYKKFGPSFAVNLCLCDPNQDTKNILNVRKKNYIQNNDIKRPSKSISKTKPITSRKPLVEMRSGKKRKSGHSCRSDIVCFHKVPSNTSIDKLLETLVKWKCDLSKLKNKSSKQKFQSNENSTILDERTKQETANNAYNNLNLCGSNLITAKISTGIAIPSGMPINTDSEYIRAINLESLSKNQEYCDEGNSGILKPTNSIECVCKNSLDLNEQNINIPSLKMESTQNNEQLPHNEDKVSNVLLADDHQFCIEFLGVTLTDEKSKEIISKKHKSPKSELPLIIENNNERENYPPKVQYNIANNNSHTLFNRPVNQALGKQQGDYNENDHRSSQKNISEPDGFECVCCNNKEDESNELEVNAFQLLKEHLREKLQEFKTSCNSTCINAQEEELLFSNILKKVKQVIRENTGSLICKCARKIPIDSTWNRAHMLLEEYLKIKIERVKCLCPPTKDSDKTILSDLLEKVCVLIDNDFTRLKNMCKCKDLDKKYGTELPEKDVNNIFCNDHLGDVHISNNKRGCTNKTSDFEDLYTVSSGAYCDRNDTRSGGVNDMKTNFINNKNILKELVNDLKNIDTKVNNSCKEAEMINKSNSPTILTQNMSSQLSTIIHNTDTKSCDAMKVDTRSEQTSLCPIKVTKLCGTNDFFINHCNQIKHKGTLSKDVVHDNQLQRCVPIEKISFSSLRNSKNHIVDDTFLTHNNMENYNTDKIETLKTTPYVGYTIDCSCDRTLGICNCTKTMISEKRNISDMWNTLTSKKVSCNKTSYIMDAIAKENIVETKINKEDVENVDSMQPIMKTTCDSKTGTLYIDEIILKDSNVKITKKCMSATTSGEVICDSEFEGFKCNNLVKQSHQCLNDSNENIFESSLYYSAGHLMNRGKSLCRLKSDPINLPTSLSSDCDCNMVPICHVKMLVTNIENKLMHSKCTCDSLCVKACPVHSKNKKL